MNRPDPETVRRALDKIERWADEKLMREGRGVKGKKKASAKKGRRSRKPEPDPPAPVVLGKRVDGSVPDRAVVARMTRIGVRGALESLRAPKT